MSKILLALFLCSSLFAQSPKSLVHKYQKREAFKNSQWSVYAQYVENGKTIVDHNGHHSLTPASGLKLFTTATALDILGEDFRFTTRLYLNGKIEKGRLNGNLIIIGGGDPTLGSAQVKGSLPLDSLMMNWTQAIKKIGIKKFKGDIITFTGLYDEQATPGYWYWVDLGNYYGAGSHALNINDNLYHLFFKPAKRIGSPAKVLRTEPEIPNLTFINNMKTGKKGSGDNGYIYCAPNQFSATLRGTIPAGVKEFSIKGAIPDPGLFAAQELKRSLEKNNIKINGKAKVSGSKFVFDEKNVFHTTSSPPLREIIYIINKRSNNLYTEAIGKMAGLKTFNYGSNKNSVKAISAFFERNNLDDEMDLYDVCGLSPTNTITTKMMVELLVKMTGHKSFDAFYNSMAVAGNKDDIGYFKNWGQGTLIENNARIKSGTINRVKSHSGYVRDRKGRLIAFSMIANNYKGRAKNINNMHKKILIALAKLN